MMVAVSSSDLAGIGSARAGMAAAMDWSRASEGREGGSRLKAGMTIGGSFSPGANRISCRFSAGALSGTSLGLIERALVSTSPIATASGRREMAGPSARKVPRGRSRIASAWRRSMPSRSAARAMSISRKVRPIRKLLASAATFLASLASRWVAITPASPRLRPRHIKLVMAESEARRTSSATSPPPGGREQLRLVDHHQRRIPMVARRIEQGRQEGGGAAHLAFRLQPFEAEHHRSAMLADPAGEPGDVALAMVGGLDRDMAVAVGERDEIALGIDHHLLDLAGALLEQAAEQVRLAAARIALHQQAGRQQLLKVDGDGIAGRARRPCPRARSLRPPVAG